jgi:hypothetical protein
MESTTDDNIAGQRIVDAFASSYQQSEVLPLPANVSLEVIEIADRSGIDVLRRCAVKIHGRRRLNVLLS